MQYNYVMAKMFQIFLLVIFTVFTAMRYFERHPDIMVAPVEYDVSTKRMTCLKKDNDGLVYADTLTTSNVYMLTFNDLLYYETHMQAVNFFQYARVTSPQLTLTVPSGLRIDYTVQTVQSMQQGKTEYVTKPVTWKPLYVITNNPCH